MNSEFVTVRREVLEQAIDALSEADNVLTSSMFAEAATALRSVLERPVVTPDFCEFCGGNDETPQEHCTDCTRPVPGKDRIREIFMSAGFTVKDGQTDLKQYVYDAAYALLNEAPQPTQQPGGAS